VNTRFNSSIRVTSFGFAAALVIAAALAIPTMIVPMSVANASAPLNNSLFCLSLGHSRFECQLTVSGGTPPYTNYWINLDNTGPWQIIGSDWALGTCERPYQNARVAVWSADSAGVWSYTTTWFYCGDAL
jgi:hypothetical protein